jgi:hypothetical protein
MLADRMTVTSDDLEVSDFNLLLDDGDRGSQSVSESL